MSCFGMTTLPPSSALLAGGGAGLRLDMCVEPHTRFERPARPVRLLLATFKDLYKGNCAELKSNSQDLLGARARAGVRADQGRACGERCQCAEGAVRCWLKNNLLPKTKS
ncbi:hypothetical protein EVAR_67670_1 [Eumeta japonica]|uniref:Uncharacterized protein n=1 Tax=Eumeta variegata TaxID=151549 RepID=A0A4C1Z5H1_EUMVA|nr:hypothetical protein EVAR_67670_1 [Eumeta japonica]